MSTAEIQSFVDWNDSEIQLSEFEVKLHSEEKM